MKLITLIFVLIICSSIVTHKIDMQIMSHPIVVNQILTHIIKTNIICAITATNIVYLPAKHIVVELIAPRSSLSKLGPK